MNPKLLESTEFYHRRYHNFSTLIIIPSFLLFIVIILFMIFGRMDISINNTGVLMPESTPTSIQNQSNNFITSFHMQNNQFIKRGQTLLTYQNNKVLASPQSGIFHANEDNMNKQLLAAGSEIGTIYPKLDSKTPLIVQTYISANNISSIKKGQLIHYQCSTNNKTAVFSGYIKEISKTPDTYNNHNYYKIICKINPDQKDFHNMRYGLEGKIHIIIGQESIFNHIKNLK